MIETMIKALINAGITDIYITVGYKKEKYYYLKEKYGNITFIENLDYDKKNTISSFHAALEFFGEDNWIVSESDLYLVDQSIIKNTIDQSRYFIREVDPQNYEWGFILNSNRIVKIVRPEPQQFLDHHMYGVAYWLKEDLDQIKKRVAEVYSLEASSNLAYDEVINELYDKLDVGVIRLKSNQIYEIDCLDDLVKVDKTYLPLLDERNE